MTLSVVELPPNVPQPSVIEQASPVVIPQQPCAAGELTRIRPAGIARANRSTRAALVLWITAVWPAPAIAQQRLAAPQPFVLAVHREHRQERRELFAGVRSCPGRTALRKTVPAPPAERRRIGYVRTMPTAAAMVFADWPTKSRAADPVFAIDRLAPRNAAASSGVRIAAPSAHQRLDERRRHAGIDDQVVLGAADEAVVERLARDDRARRASRSASAQIHAGALPGPTPIAGVPELYAA